MTSNVELLPCPFCGSPAEIDKGGLGEVFAACSKCWCHMGGAWSTTESDAIAAWNRRAIAAKDAEVEVLRAEAEKLRALAACAYQMAGIHGAPLVWLDRLSEAANGDALPDVDTLMDELLPYQPDAVCEAEAENKRLRAEVEDYRTNGAGAVRFAPSSAYWSNELRRLFGDEARNGIEILESRYRQELARADKLTEALREAYRQVRELCDCYGHAYPEASFARYEALLREQEEV